MDGEHNWNAEKKDLKQLSIIDLQDKLRELEKNRSKLETQLRMDGHSNKRFAYSSLSRTSYKGGNLKKVKKTIAVIRTIIKEKEI